MAASPAPDGVRTDIQALRAVAVMMVVLNHLWPDRLTGGYVGVDVFFVISGYLITSHLLKEANRDGRVRLARFWARRARRLLPAALLVLGFCVVFTLVWMPLASWSREFGQIGAAALYILNWVLSFGQLDYFQLGADQTLVTHYWSLSVEEQFYIVWPVLLVVALLLTRRAGPKTRRVILAVGVALVLAASLMWAVYATARIPAAAYFQTSTRAWEFAAGGLLAFAPALLPRLRERLTAVLWVGWLMIFGSAFFLTPASGVPGLAALLPVVGTIVVIAVGEGSNRWSPRPVTSLRPIAFLGDVSYSLYLWHWPLIVITPLALGRGLTFADKAVILAISIALAALTKKFVEDPVRFGRLAVARPRVVIGAALASMLVVGGGSVASAAVIDRGAAEVVARLETQSRNPSECFGAQAALSGATCDDLRSLADPMYMNARGPMNLLDDTTGGTECEALGADDDIRVCSFGTPTDEQRLGVALVGDSHAEMWAGALDGSMRPVEARVFTFLKGGCPATADLDVSFAAATPAGIADCTKWRQEVIPMVAADSRFDVIITSARGWMYSDDGQEDSGAGYVDAWNQWLAAGKRVIVIADTPEFSTANCASRPDSERQGCVLPRDVAIVPTGLSRAIEAMPPGSIEVIDYTAVFCDSDCHSVVGGIPAFYDGNHLNEYFARSFGPDWLASIGVGEAR